jgi:ParB family chromosome partitioning protein
MPPQLDKHVHSISESIGARSNQSARPAVPTADPKSIGVRPLQNAVTIAVERIRADPQQPRRQFTEDELQRLAKSIQDRGQFSPILVRWCSQEECYFVIAGERRLRATRLAGLATIECVVREDQSENPSELLEQQLIENCLREDLTVTEEATSFRRLMEMNGWSAKSLSEELRVSETRISRAVAILKLPPSLREKVDTGEIPARAAYELSRITNSTLRSRLAAEVMTGRLKSSDIRKSARPTKGARGHRLEFGTEAGWAITVQVGRSSSYDELEASLLEVLEDVRTRIASRIFL